MITTSWASTARTLRSPDPPMPYPDSGHGSSIFSSHSPPEAARPSLAVLVVMSAKTVLPGRPATDPVLIVVISPYLACRFHKAALRYTRLPYPRPKVTNNSATNTIQSEERAHGLP